MTNARPAVPVSSRERANWNAWLLLSALRISSFLIPVCPSILALAPVGTVRPLAVGSYLPRTGRRARPVNSSVLSGLRSFYRSAAAVASRAADHRQHVPPL